MKKIIAVVLPYWEPEHDRTLRENVGQKMFFNNLTRTLDDMKDEICFIFVPDIPGSDSTEAGDYLRKVLSESYNNKTPVFIAGGSSETSSLNLLSKNLKDYAVVVFGDLLLEKHVEYLINQVWNRTFQRLVIGLDHLGISENLGRWYRRLDETLFSFIPDRLREIITSNN